ncbi:MAG: DegQ family serine endoprotease [Gammaproteobacteria bacterium]|nr:MAG: DegQ family serine endoprotease [Gammaproteobacteria bacterium]
MRLVRFRLLQLVLLCLLGAIVAMPASARMVNLPDFSPLVEQVSPAVVNISTKRKSPVADLPRNLQIPEDAGPLGDLLKRFLEQAPGMLPPDALPDAESLGSGFIISQDGYIVTNSHVVKDAEEIIVRLSDRREFKARLVGTDERSDVSLLKIEATGLPTVRIGRSADLKVGEWVLAIGSPFGFEHSATAGIVSAKHRSLPNENYVPFIQTDVAINPGNSGGPLFNLDGEVVGINSQIYSQTGGFMGLSFAIPIDVAMNVVHQLKEKGRVSRGWLGVYIQEVTRELADSFGMKQPRGALVAQVLDDGPAHKAGLRVGDIILAYNGTPIIHSSDLPPLVGNTPVGSKARVRILRNGKELDLLVRIEELPARPQQAEKGAQPEPSNREDSLLGMQLAPLPTERARALGIDHGVLVQSVTGNPARAAGIEPGDVIVMLGNRQVRSVKDLRQQLERIGSGRTVAILVQREEGPVFLALRKP